MNPTSTSYLLQKVAPLVMRELGPRVGPYFAERVGIPLARKVGLPIARRIGYPIARKAGTLLVNRVGYPLINKMLLKANITPPDLNPRKANKPTSIVKEETGNNPDNSLDLKKVKKPKKLKNMFFGNLRSKTKTKTKITPVPAIPVNPSIITAPNPAPLNQNTTPTNYISPAQEISEQDNIPYMNYNSSLFNRRRNI